MFEEYINNGLITRRVHPEYPLSIYNYTAKCAYERAWDDITVKARGLVFDDETGEQLSNPLPKFFNYEEIDKTEIPVSKPIIMDKVDGFLGILYWYNGVPSIATRGSFISEMALWATEYFRQHAVYDEFNKNYTYMFEIICPQNDKKLIVNYSTYELVLIAVRDIKTGKDFDIREFNLTNFRNAEVFDFEQVDYDFLKQNERDNAEGFVIFFPDIPYRFKIKYETYFRRAYVKKFFDLKYVYKELSKGRTAFEILQDIPDEFYSLFDEYYEKINKAYLTIYALSLFTYNKIKHLTDRKEQALLLRDSPVKHVVFYMISGYKNKINKNLWRLVEKWLNF